MDENNEVIERRSGKIRSWFKDPYNIALICIMALALAIRLYFFFVTKSQPLWWDEAEYMLKANNFAFGTPDTGWFSLRPILFPAIAAFFLKIGAGETLIRFVWVILSTAGIYLIYFIGKELFNKKVGLIAALASLTFYLDLFYSTRLLVDLPQVFFVLLGMALFVKYFFNDGKKKLVWWILPVLIIGVLIRFTVGLEIIILLVFLLIALGLKLFKKTEWYWSILFAFILFIPYMIYSWFVYHNPLFFLTTFSQGAATRLAADTPFHVFMQYINYFPYYTSLILFIIFLIGFILVIFLFLIRYDQIRNSKESQKYLLLLLWIIIPLIYFGFFVNHFEDRYIFMVFPAVFIIAGFGINYLVNLIKGYKKLAYIIIILLLVFSSYQMFSNSDSLIKSKVSSYDSLKYGGLWIKDNSNRTDTIISSAVPEITYYSQRATYPFSDNESSLVSLINQTHPKYLILTIWERSPDWAYQWPDKNQDKLKVVQAYFTDPEKTKASLVIYQFI